MFSKLYKFSKFVVYLNSCSMDLGHDTIPTIPTDSPIKTHHTHRTYIYTNIHLLPQNKINKYYITETFEPLLISRENATLALLAPYSPATFKEVDSMPYMTEISESEKEKKKEKKTLVAELTPLLLLSLFSCCHLTSPVISLYYSSFLSLPCLSISSPCSHVLSHTTILYLFIYFLYYVVIVGSWFMSHLTSHVNLL